MRFVAILGPSHLGVRMASVARQFVGESTGRRWLACGPKPDRNAGHHHCGCKRCLRRPEGQTLPRLD